MVLRDIPKLIDEPTIGLDVVVKDNIRKAIAAINAEEKTTVILTTHDLGDIETLSKRIVMIDKGRNVFSGTVGDLKESYGQMRQLNFELERAEELEKLDYKSRFNLSDDDIALKSDGLSCEVRFNSAHAPVSEVVSYTLATAKVSDISVKDADIEEIIRRLYQKGVEADA